MQYGNPIFRNSCPGFFLLCPLRAQLSYTSGPADIGIGFEDDALVPRWHFHAGAVVGGMALPDECGFSEE